MHKEGYMAPERRGLSMLQELGMGSEHQNDGKVWFEQRG